MKNRVLLTATALAALSSQFATAAKGLVARAIPNAFGSETGTNIHRPPRINRRRGMSTAQSKRAARKRRNVLRARGHHRQAVR